MKELLKYLLTWPAYVLAFILIGTAVLKGGEFLAGLFQDLKDRRNKK